MNIYFHKYSYLKIRGITLTAQPLNVRPEKRQTFGLDIERSDKKSRTLGSRQKPTMNQKSFLYLILTGPKVLI
jgi:hypothetical protein